MLLDGFETNSFWEKTKREFLKRSVSLLVSLAAHVLVISLLVVFYAPIKILDFGGEVRDVFIAPPIQRLFLPEQDQAPLPSDVDRTAAGPRQPGLPAVSILKSPAPAPTAPELVLPDLNELPSRLAQDFNLRPDLETPSEMPPGLSFQLAPDRGLPAYEYTPRSDRLLPQGALDKYIQPMDLRLRSEQGKVPMPGTAHTVSVESRSGKGRADITRWAEQSVARILANWFIPILMTDQQVDEIVIALTVQRDGWIASTEVLQSGRVPELQAAALKALELSVPLPRLPREFPEKSLEIQVVFARK